MSTRDQAYQTPIPCKPGVKHPDQQLAFQGLAPMLYDIEVTDSVQFMVGLRFWVARLYWMLLAGSGEAWSAGARGLGILGPDMSTWPAVIGVETLGASIAVVITRDSLEEVTYIILASNGEIITRSREPVVETTNELFVRGCPVRSDWSSPIEKGTFDPIKVIKTKNSFAAPGGVCASWRTRASAEELSIAERVALSSCAPESFSGPNLSAAEMDAEHLGRPSGTKQESRQLELYLSEQRQVSSIHIPGHPFHTDIAIAHRSNGLSDYVLRETGQVNGDENGGVAPIWQGVLACDEKGIAGVDTTDFWSDWQDRVETA